MFFFPYNKRIEHQSTGAMFPCKYLTKTCFISLLINLLILNEILQRPSHRVSHFFSSKATDFSLIVMNVTNYITFRYTLWLLLPWSSGWIILLRCLLGSNLQNLAKTRASLILSVNFLYNLPGHIVPLFIKNNTLPYFSIANLSLVAGLLSSCCYLHLEFVTSSLAVLGFLQAST